MSVIEGAYIYLKLDGTEQKYIYELLKKYCPNVEYYPKNELYQLPQIQVYSEVYEEYETDYTAMMSFESAMDLNHGLYFTTYEEKPLSENFIDSLLKNTTGDFIFTDSDGKIVLERRNGTIFANEDQSMNYGVFFIDLLSFEYVTFRIYGGYFEGSANIELEELISGICEVFRSSICYDEKMTVIRKPEYPQNLSISADQMYIETVINTEENLKFMINMEVLYSEKFDETQRKKLRDFISTVTKYIESIGSVTEKSVDRFMKL